MFFMPNQSNMNSALCVVTVKVKSNFSIFDSRNTPHHVRCVEMGFVPLLYYFIISSFLLLYNLRETTALRA